MPWLAAALLAPLMALGCAHERGASVEPQAQAQAEPETKPLAQAEAAPRPTTQAAAEPRPLTQAAAQLPVYIETAPAKLYRELGLLQASGTGAKASEAAMLGSLRERGKSMGCDAVTDVAVDVGETKAHAIGVCVQWVDAEPKGAFRH